MIYKGYEIRLERPGWIQSSLSDDGSETLGVVGTVQDYDKDYYCVFRDGARVDLGELYTLDDARECVDDQIYRNSVKGPGGRPVQIIVTEGGKNA